MHSWMCKRTVQQIAYLSRCVVNISIGICIVVLIKLAACETNLTEPWGPSSCFLFTRKLTVVQVMMLSWVLRAPVFYQASRRCQVCSLQPTNDYKTVGFCAYIHVFSYWCLLFWSLFYLAWLLRRYWRFVVGSFSRSSEWISAKRRKRAISFWQYQIHQEKLDCTSFCPGLILIVLPKLLTAHSSRLLCET